MIKFDYCLGGLPLNRVNQIKCLGILFVLLLDFCSHIDYIACKTVCFLNYIEQLLSNFNSLKYFPMLHCALVRTVLEYGATD